MASSGNPAPHPFSKTFVRLQYLRALARWGALGFPRRKGSFQLDHHSFTYYSNRYNVTWLNERCVEIPMGLHLLQKNRGARILEVGNVLSHYLASADHDIIDKYEASPRHHVIRADASDYAPKTRYDLIVSLSTLEHVGWDEKPVEKDKALKTIHHLRNLLTPSGLLFFTVPAGYHPHLDKSLLDGQAGLTDLMAIKRISSSNDWEKSEVSRLEKIHFGSPYPFANGLFLGFAGNLERF